MFGPGEENPATMGASESKAASLVWMVPTGLLQITSSDFSISALQNAVCLAIGHTGFC